MNMQAQVGSITFDSPLLVASGYITETPEFFLKARRFGCSGIVTRSLKQNVPAERSRVPAPRYSIFDGSSMLNCEWGNEHPWTCWRDGWAAQVQSTGKRLIVSMSGRDIESCSNLIPAFNDKADAFEVNISCSHSGALHGNLNLDFVHLRKLFAAIRPLTRLPIWLKLSYSPFVVEMAAEGEKAGADAIVCTNSIGPGMLIDIGTGIPKVGIKGGAGGVTGPAIFPIALRCIYEIKKTVTIPVVGVGGVSSADEAIQMIMAGASAVQIYTAATLKGPRVFGEMLRDMSAFMAAHPEFPDIGSMVGLSLDKASSHRFAAPIPKIGEGSCTGCGICIPSCAFDALKLSAVSGSTKAVIKDNCVGCNACVGVCPPEIGAISTTYTL